jgi:hypothetical protein
MVRLGRTNYSEKDRLATTSSVDCIRGNNSNARRILLGDFFVWSGELQKVASLRCKEMRFLSPVRIRCQAQSGKVGSDCSTQVQQCMQCM